VRISLDGMVFRIKEQPEGTGPLILLHGWGGDADAMWLFEHSLPPARLTLSPQGPYTLPSGGYEWIQDGSSALSVAEAFRAGAETLARFLERMGAAHDFKAEDCLLLGFSQGAALAFAAVQLGLLRPGGLAALAGFLPPGDDARLKDVPVFWAHGRHDDVIPFSQAQEGALRLQMAGAALTFCESQTAHKVDRHCLKRLQAWAGEVFAA